MSPSEDNIEIPDSQPSDDRFAPLTWSPAPTGVYGLDHGATPAPTIPMLDFDELMRLQQARANPTAPLPYAPTLPSAPPSTFASYPAPRPAAPVWVPYPPTAPAPPRPVAPPVPVAAAPQIPRPPESPLRANDPATGSWPKHLGPARTPFEHASAIGTSAPPVPLLPAPPTVPLPRTSDDDEEEESSITLPLPPLLPGELPPPPPKSPHATVQSAVGLAWTALLLAVLIPPVGIAVGWYCITIVRELGTPESASITSQVSVVSIAAIAVGVVATMGVIAMLL